MKPHDLPFPTHALAAVTHHNPYPYYDALAAVQGWYFDPGLDLWVAASAAAVEEVLAHPCCQAPSPAAGAVADLREAREYARLIGRRLWRPDKFPEWMTCVPELAVAGLGGALPALGYEAATGLIGNGVLALLREPEDERSGLSDMEALVCAVSRFDPPVQNTRRVVTGDCEIGGVALRAGQKILLVLAAASRDVRGGCQAYGLGFSDADCAYHQLACALAAGALQGMLTALRDQRGPALQAWLSSLVWTYRPSSSLRIPQFSQWT
ncbi:hypothetical protein [Duganella callida]|uniref:Uncharacterized protein n=1 Tax=Duganella callida TaxID=2561932 RepID=A0A4Y9SLR7_9BURK|nr:hypothetical protein [Duganella callida]TFW25233.1 hypothetical protein E4L98_09460 [Duganella callida]